MSFKGQKDGFTINLALNSANILEIQAVSPRESFAFAIDQTYLHQHDQFINLIRDPRQILQFFENSFQKVTFSEGRLAFPYTGVNSVPRNVSILLFRERALSVLEQKLAEQQARIVALINANNDKVNIRFENLQKTVKTMEGDIQSLKQKTEDLQRQINQVRQNCQGKVPPIPPPDLTKTYRIAAEKQSQQVMDVNGDPLHNKNIIVWQFQGGNNQKWKLEDLGNGQYIISSVQSGLVLQIPEILGPKPDQVRVGQKTGTSKQKWRINSFGAGFSIKSVYNGHALIGFAPFNNGSRVAFSNSQTGAWFFYEV